MPKGQGHITIRRRPKDGTSAVRLDLTNQNASILYDGEGTNISGTITSEAKLYEGADEVTTGRAFSISERSGCNESQATIDSATGVVTVTNISTSGYLIVQVTYKEVTYAAKLVLTKIVGNVKYDLVVTPNAIAYNSTTGEKSAETIVAQVFRTSATSDGKSTREAAARIQGGYMKVGSTIVNYWNKSGYEIPVDFSKAEYTVAIYVGSVEQDSETIPINRVKNGDGSIRLDLTNQNDSILYDAEGNKLSEDITSQAIVYDGASDVDADKVTWEMPSGQMVGTTTDDAKINDAGEVTISKISTSGHVVIRATYGGVTLSTQLNFTKIVGTTKYDLVVTPNAIAYNSTTGEKSAETITVKIYKTTANGSGGVTTTQVDALPSKVKLYADDADVSSLFNSVYEHTVDPDRSDHVFIVKVDSMEHDSETVPINKTKNGTEGNGISETIVEYGASAYQTTQPTSWSKTKPTLYQGYWLWTRTTIKYTDTSKADTVSYSVTYISKDGVSISIDTPSRTFIYNSDGTLLNGSFITNIRLYDGSMEINPTAVTWSAEADDTSTTGKPTYRLSYRGVLTVEDVKHDGYITISATYDDVVYTIKFIYTREVREATYDLSVNPMSVTYKKGLTPESVTVIVQKTIEGAGGAKQTTNVSSLPSGYTLRVNGTAVTYPGTSGYSFMPKTSLAKNIVNLIYDGSEYRRVEVTVTQVEDGEKGADGKGIYSQTEYYAVGTATAVGTNWYEGTPPAFTSEYKYLWKYTVTTYTDGTSDETTPCIVGAVGSEGLTVRQSTWTVGTEYHNDNNPFYRDENGVGYLDVVTKTDMIIYSSANPPDAWECQLTHKAANSADPSTNPPQYPLPASQTNNKAWVAFNSSRPIITSLILANKIVAGMIDVEDLAADSAFITNLTAKHLQTATLNPSSKVIAINKDDLGYIQVYEGLAERVRISGQAVDDVSDLITETTYTSSTTRRSITIAKDSTPPAAYRDITVYTSSQFAFDGAAFSIKDTTLNVTLPLLNTTEQSLPDWGAVEARVELYNTSSSSVLATFSAVSKDVTRTTAGYTASMKIVAGNGYAPYPPPISTIKHYLKLILRIRPNYSITAVKTGYINSYTLKGAFIANAKMMYIGNNGFCTMWGVNNYVSVTADNDVQIRNGSVGMNVQKNNLQLIMDNLKYNLSIDTAKDTDGSTINVLKLTQTS